VRRRDNPSCTAGCDRAGQWSLRVNDQFRICLRWTGNDAEDVEIVDYH
jgi:proteic killer suppression protein